MAVVELQFSEQSFLDLVGSETLRPPLASCVLDEVRRRRAVPQPARLRLTGAEWASPFLRAGEPEPGGVLVKVTLAVDLTGRSVQWPGAPIGPLGLTRCLIAEVWIEVSVSPGGPSCRLAELRVVAPVATLPPVSAPLLNREVPLAVDHGAIVVGDGVVSVRLASTPGDDVHGAVANHLAGQDWARVVPGALLAEWVAAALGDGLDAARRWSDTEVRIENEPVGRWRGTPVAAAAAPIRGGRVFGDRGVGVDRVETEPLDPDGEVSASARLVGVGALPFAFDLPFTLDALTRMTISRSRATGAPPMLATTTVVSVTGRDPGVLASFGAPARFREELRAGLDGRLDSTPTGAVATEERCGELRITTRQVLAVPTTRAWAGVVVEAGFGADGLVVRGVMALRQVGDLDLRGRHVKVGSLRDHDLGLAEVVGADDPLALA